ncbi:ATP-binding protein [Oceanospirillaceae bacterium]|nr:ATP-binding protein [Oceanospirillaceae bacterium]
MENSKSIDDIIVELHNSVSSFPNDVSKKRKQLRNFLQDAYGEKNKELSLSDTIDQITGSVDMATLRDLAVILLRVISMKGALTESTTKNQLDGRLSVLFERSLPDFGKRFEIDSKEQTYIKLQKFGAIHEELCKRINVLNEIGSSLHSIIGARQKISKVLNDKQLQAYLLPYGLKQVREQVSIFFIEIEQHEKSPELFFDNIPNLVKRLEEEIQYCNGHSTFVTRDYYYPFLNTLKDTVVEEQKRSRNNFQCEITSSGNDPIHIEKKYPLTKDNKLIRVALPLFNSGPGSAKEVKASLSVNSDSVVLVDKEVSLGDVRKGDFVIPFSFEVLDSEKSITVDVLVEWTQPGQIHPSDKIFQFLIEGQNPDIDWDAINSVHPYSEDIARGPAFIGRQDLVSKILSKFHGSKMESSYISGQKRVGKSSLAQAVIDKATDNDNLQFILKEVGDFVWPDGKETLNALGKYLTTILSEHLPKDVTYISEQFNGSLAPLAMLCEKLENHAPEKKFVIVLDEFDEINHDLYRYGSLAETFFLNLRAISGKKNIAFILVGGEKMAHVMSSQGDKLNKFSGISLDIFNQETEWGDYEDLIRAHSPADIQWHDSAVRAIYEQTNGHPYYTNKLCGKLLARAIKFRDAEITKNEVISYLPNMIDELESNVFMHFWKDGLEGDHKEIEAKQTQRCHVLTAFARAFRKSSSVNTDSIIKQASKTYLNSEKINIVLREFCVRKIMNEEDGEYYIRVKLFAEWLTSKGLNMLITDQLGEELLEDHKKKEQDAFVAAVEIQNLIKKWPNYQGKQVTTDDVRAWLEQDEDHINQRLLFKLLQNLRFPRDEETKEKFKGVHNNIRKDFSVYVQTKKSERRNDIIVTYVDGQGKSGAHHSGLYCHENQIATSCNIEVSMVSQTIESNHKLGNDINGIIIVDDFIGTGQSFASNLSRFMDHNIETLSKHNIPIRVVVLFASASGETYVRAQMSQLEFKEIDLVVCETLDAAHQSFGEGKGFWSSEDEKGKAKALCQKYGVKVAKRAPLGYAEEGLLFTFTRNCPNNTLPIIHAEKTGKDGWKPLFKRTFT